MTKEDKDLLLKDLCARLPYGIKIHAKYSDAGTNVEVEKDGILSMVDNDTIIAFTSDDSNCYNYVGIHEVKPYLIPLCSMTKEQRKEYDEMYEKYKYSPTDIVDWYYRNHIDNRGLIIEGLAIDATRLNIY